MGVQVAIYADKDPGGKKFIATLKRRLKNEGASNAGLLGAFKSPEPTLLATISDGPSSDRVLGFVVGMLTRHAEPLGVAGVGIPLTGSASRR